MNVGTEIIAITDRGFVTPGSVALVRELAVRDSAQYRPDAVTGLSTPHLLAVIATIATDQAEYVEEAPEQKVMTLANKIRAMAAQAQRAQGQVVPEVSSFTPSPEDDHYFEADLLAEFVERLDQADPREAQQIEQEFSQMVTPKMLMTLRDRSPESLGVLASHMNEFDQEVQDAIKAVLALKDPNAPDEEEPIQNLNAEED